MFDSAWQLAFTTRDRDLVQVLLDIGPVEFQHYEQTKPRRMARVKGYLRDGHLGRAVEVLRQLEREVTADEHYELEHRRKTAATDGTGW